MRNLWVFGFFLLELVVLAPLPVAGGGIQLEISSRMWHINFRCKC